MANVSRPTSLPVTPEHIPAELKALPQWVIWRYFWKADKRKWDKPPLNARIGNAASSTNLKTWSTFDQAMAAYTAGGFDGIGLALVKVNGIVGVDLDHCRDRREGALGGHPQDVPLLLSPLRPSP